MLDAVDHSRPSASGRSLPGAAGADSSGGGGARPRRRLGGFGRGCRGFGKPVPSLVVATDPIADEAARLREALKVRAAAAAVGEGERNGAGGGGEEGGVGSVGGVGGMGSSDEEAAGSVSHEGPSLDESSLADVLWERTQRLASGEVDEDGRGDGTATGVLLDSGVVRLMERLARAEREKLAVLGHPAPPPPSQKQDGAEGSRHGAVAVASPAAAVAHAASAAESEGRPSKHRGQASRGAAEERAARFGANPPTLSRRRDGGWTGEQRWPWRDESCGSFDAGSEEGGGEVREDAAAVEMEAGTTSAAVELEAEAEAPALVDGTRAIEVTASVQGVRVVVRRRDIDNEEGPDPYFFEADYSVAASTGMLMWEGSWAAIELLRRSAVGGGEGGGEGRRGGGKARGAGEGSGRSGVDDLWLQRLVRGRRVVELGSGIGLLGLCLAAAGGHVLLTDVPSVVENTLGPNVEGSGPPCATGGAVKGPGSGSGPSEVADAAEADTLSGWREARRVGQGSAATQPLDWWKPIDQQLGANDPRDAEVIIAAECVWLRELIPPFVQTVVSLLRQPHRPVCVLAFRDRSTETSETFSSLSCVLSAFEGAGVMGTAKGACDAPESEGLHTSFYELACVVYVTRAPD